MHQFRYPVGFAESKQTSVIELVKTERFTTERLGFLLPSHTRKDGGLESASFRIVPVAQERPVDFIKGFGIIAAQTTDLGAGEISGILPGSVPGSFVEPVVSLVPDI